MPRKIGRTFALLAALAAGALLPVVHFLPSASAKEKEIEVEFTADVDRALISVDESVSLRLKIRIDGSAKASEPRFSAPDFDEINQYSSVFVESYYENGRFGMRNNHSVTKVLRPKRTGDLKISNIRVEIDGKSYAASDVIVQVRAGGAGTPPPKGYGGTGVGLRGAGKQINHRNVLIRAEIDKDRAYKGEQVIVSYYIYTRVQLFNIAVDKWPTLNGFLREDLETPVMSSTGRMDSEQITLDGVPYRRSLLVRYAAYPLQDGKLKIDPLALKYNYYPPRSGGGMDDEEDPFMGFFQQMQVRPGNDRSDTLTLDVIPVPEEGRPNSFTGGVGDFNLSSAVDKTEVKANEAVSLTLKVEGRGNVASIGEPKAKWPDQVELYDSKGRAKTGRAGVGEKIFEFLLIPRSPGPLVLPKIEMSFFDPQKKTYVTKSTEPVTINVQPGAPGSAPLARTAPAAPANTGTAPAPQKKEELSYLKAPAAQGALAPAWPVWRILYWAALASLLGFVLIVARDLLEKGKVTAQAMMEAKAKAHARSWEKLRADAQAANTKSAQRLAWKDVVAAYDLLASSLFDALERLHPEGLRSRPRPEIRDILMNERNLPEALWQRIEKVLEYTDMVRFASSAGVISEENARSELPRWIDEAQSIARVISQRNTK